MRANDCLGGFHYDPTRFPLVALPKAKLNAIFYADDPINPVTLSNSRSIVNGLLIYSLTPSNSA